jgi:hypothetical protein
MCAAAWVGGSHLLMVWQQRTRTAGMQRCHSQPGYWSVPVICASSYVHRVCALILSFAALLHTDLIFCCSVAR